MFAGRKVAVAGVALAAVLLLGGCVPSTAAGPDTGFTRTPVPLPPVPTADPGSDTWVDRGASFDVTASVAVIGSYVSTVDSGYSFRGQNTDAFPAGSRVIVVKIRLDGFVPFGQADVTGLNLDATKFDGRPELAVLDTNEGASFASDNQTAWLPEGIFGDSGKPWLLGNHAPVEFAAAWYVPAGVTDLEIRLGIPAAADFPIPLRVPVQSGE